MYPAVEFQDGDLRTKSSMVTRKCRDLTGSGRDERNTLCPVFGVILGFVECCEKEESLYGSFYASFI